MNLPEEKAKLLMCPILSAGQGGCQQCEGSACFLWQWDEPMFDGPDSYVSEPGPTGHCGLSRQEDVK